uniref:Unannotated protein n=1 Tax=freshwater metagenome TaxID=449393 RepID=A0A6J7PNV2_9ZZZZ
MHVDTDESRPAALGKSGRPTHHGVAARCAGDTDNHPFPHVCLRERGWGGDGETVNHPLEQQDPEQRECLAVEQLGVFRSGIAVEHVAVGDAPANRLWRDIDEFDLIRPGEEAVGDEHRRHSPDDLAHGVGKRFDVLHGDRGDDVDAVLEQFIDVLPPRSVSRRLRVGGTKVINQDDSRATRPDTADRERFRGQGQRCIAHQFLEHCRSGGPTARVDTADHHVCSS